MKLNMYIIIYLNLIILKITTNIKKISEKKKNKLKKKILKKKK